MKNDKTDIEVVRQRLFDLIELWCVLNTCKGDESAWEIMKEISAVVNKDAILKRWREKYPLKKDPTSEMEFSDDADYIANRRKIIQRLVV